MVKPIVVPLCPLYGVLLSALGYQQFKEIVRYSLAFAVVANAKWFQVLINLRTILSPMHGTALMIIKMQNEPVFKGLIRIGDFHARSFCDLNGVIEILSWEIIFIKDTPYLIVFTLIV